MCFAQRYTEITHEPLLFSFAQGILTVHRETLTQYITFKRGGRGESVLCDVLHRRLGAYSEKIPEGGTSKYFFGGFFFPYYIQLCFICRPSDSIVPTDAGIDPGPLQLVHWQSDALTTRLDLIRWDRYLYSPSLWFCLIHFTISLFGRSEFRAGWHGGGGGGQHRQPAPRAGGQPGLCPLCQEGRPADCAGALRRGSGLLHTRRFSENCPLYIVVDAYLVGDRSN